MPFYSIACREQSCTTKSSPVTSSTGKTRSITDQLNTGRAISINSRLWQWSVVLKLWPTDLVYSCLALKFITLLKNLTSFILHHAQRVFGDSRVPGNITWDLVNQDVLQMKRNQQVFQGRINDRSGPEARHSFPSRERMLHPLTAMDG